jgi:hypothetical protein
LPQGATQGYIAYTRNVGVAIKNITGSYSLLFMGLLLEAIALVFFLIILFRK